MSDILKKYYKEAGFAGILILVLCFGYQLINKVFDTNQKNETRYYEQIVRCEATNAKLAEAIDNLSEVLKK